MSAVASLPPGSWMSGIHPYLRLLETCYSSLHDITNLKLCLDQRPQEWKIIVQQEWENILSVISSFVAMEQESFKPQCSLSYDLVKNMEETLLFLALGSDYSHKLQMVITQEQASAQSFQYEDSSVLRSIETLTALKISLEELTVITNKVMNYCTMQSAGYMSANLPFLDELLLVKENICFMKSSFEVEEFHDHLCRYNEDMHTTEENIMCDILGITVDFGHYLHNLDPPIREHQTDLYFLENFIENRENELSEESDLGQTLGKEGLIENLVKLGFTIERASSICASVPDDFIDLQVPSFWAMRYLEHMFSHHPLFVSVPKYPYQKEKTEEFFVQNIPLEGRCEPEMSHADGKLEWPVNIFNISDLNVSDRLIEDYLRMQGADCKLFFHGTSHKHAISILQSGINVSAGKNSQDFSSGDGFYVSEVFQNAEDWSRAGRGNPQAVVVFKVPESLIDAEQEHGIDFITEGSEGEWMQIVELCRSKYQNMNMKRQVLKGVSFIRGPVSRNPTQVGRSRPVGFGMRNPANLQLCIRDDNYAEKFGSIENISCVIFY